VEKSVTTPAINVTNQAPTNVVLGSVTAVNQTAVDVAWAAASDDATPANQLTYEVHLAEGGDFTPNASTLKFSGKNVLSAQLTGLKAATGYTVKLIVIDSQALKTMSMYKRVFTLNELIVDTSLLNDTGNISQCVNQNNVMGNCDLAHLNEWFSYNQDAQIGRDALAAKGQLAKVGSGYAGFDFTKISATGAKLPVDANTWSCVLDNHTGLMWEVKTNDSSLHDEGHRYSWYEPNTNINGGYEGEINPRYPDCGNTLTYCNTLAFVNAVNIKGLCGHQDWRLPNRQELQDIHVYDYKEVGIATPKIDITYFLSDGGRYWTSSPHGAYYSSAYDVSFTTGEVSSSNKENALYIRLVRGK
ncbi:MAG TPA: DUF1566 domain-containing protein, partial [Agitococcus sp.]|nr:DUF1566 domain-containing protein [Agitococcus sp.]